MAFLGLFCDENCNDATSNYQHISLAFNDNSRRQTTPASRGHIVLAEYQPLYSVARKSTGARTGRSAGWKSCTLRVIKKSDLL